MSVREADNGGQFPDAPIWRLALRGRARTAVRAYFEAVGYTEVDTPILQAVPGQEPHLMPFSTRLQAPFGAGAALRYLHTSPEFAMKRLIAEGSGPIYQLVHAFRNAERSRLHAPEFTMLEWYRPDADYTALMNLAPDLVRRVAAATGVDTLRHGDSECNPSQPAERLTVAEAFFRYAGLELFTLIDDDRDPDPRPLRQAAHAIGIAVRPGDRFAEVFDRILIERVEPSLGIGAMTCLYDYPLCLGALARPKAQDPRIAERIELYVCGVELANGYSELTGRKAHAERFAADSKLRQELYGEIAPPDADLLDALDRLPPCAGMSLGFDRLVMLVSGSGDIAPVLTQPVP